MARKKVHTHIEGSNPDLKMSDLSNEFNIAKQAALDEVCFNSDLHKIMLKSKIEIRFVF